MQVRSERKYYVSCSGILFIIELFIALCMPSTSWWYGLLSDRHDFDLYRNSYSIGEGLNAMEIYFIEVIFWIVSAGWAVLWGKTYKSQKIGGFIKHTVIFLLLSVLIAWIGLRLIFLPVNETYSYSNICALGLLCPIWLKIFGLGCLTAIVYTLDDLLDPQNTEGE